MQFFFEKWFFFLYLLSGFFFFFFLPHAKYLIVYNGWDISYILMLLSMLCMERIVGLIVSCMCAMNNWTCKSSYKYFLGIFDYPWKLNQGIVFYVVLKAQKKKKGEIYQNEEHQVNQTMNMAVILINVGENCWNRVVWWRLLSVLSWVPFSLVTWFWQ